MARKKKKSDPLVDEPRPERKPHIVWYDADGVEIGDDGYPMTPIRTRMHRLFNALFIWAIVAVVIGLFCTAFAYAQNQDYSMQGFDIVISGGTQVNGFDFALLLRIEGLFCLFTAIICLFGNFIGFNWMYDKRSPRTITVLLAILGIGSFFFEMAALLIAHLPDPVSLVNVLLAILIFTTMARVESERPSLSKAKRVTKVIKKK